MPNQGPITAEEFMALWRSVTDEGYSRPLLEQDGSLIEAIEQAAEQYAVVSQAIDQVTQRLFVVPFSGQTSEPASLARHATVSIQVTRTGSLERFRVFDTNFLVEQLLTDWSPTGGIEVRTHRLYRTTATRTLMPGDPGPITLQAVAELEGAAHNNPPPGTIRGIVQTAAGRSNDYASLVPGPAAHQLIITEVPDIFPPEAVGSYVRLTSGANTGKELRSIGFSPPVPGVNGGTILLAPDALFGLSSVVGTFQPGEQVIQTGAGLGQLLDVTTTRMVVQRTSGTFTPGTITGITSGASATITILQSPDLVAETATASWQILGWADDLQVVVSNPEAPTGGAYAWLEELGGERNMPLHDGETEEQYRARIWNLADVVSPNAIKRAVNKILEPLGAAVCLREVGDPVLFPGAFYDAGSSSDPVQNPTRNFAYDMDFDTRPEDRFKLALSLTESRAFFLVGVPPAQMEFFATAFDAGPAALSAYDVTALFDGDSINLTTATYRAVQQIVETIKAAGVNFELYVEDVGCF